MNRAILDRQMFAGGGAAFPDLSGDGRITQKDILMGKGVIPMAGGGNPMARGEQIKYYENGGGPETLVRGILGSILESAGSGALDNLGRGAVENLISQAVKLGGLGAGETMAVILNNQYGAREKDTTGAFLEIQRQMQEQQADMGLEAASPMVGATPPTRAIKPGGRMGGIPMAEGGMVEEGVGSLMAQETMPSPEAAMEDAVMGAAEGIGALDAAQDYEQAINSVRGDQMPIEARYEELASFVGPEDAAQTPESVLALVQPVLEMAEIDQGIGSIAPEAMGGDAPMTPEMAGGIMSNVPEAVPMEGPPENFNQGGVARLKNDQIRYYADGGPVFNFRKGGDPADAELRAELDKRLGLFQELGLGSESDRARALENQRRASKSGMLFDIADAALRFAGTPVRPGMSVASTAAESLAASKLFPRISQRADAITDFEQKQLSDKRTLNLAALTQSETSLAAKKASEASLAKEKLNNAAELLQLREKLSAEEKAAKTGQKYALELAREKGRLAQALEDIKGDNSDRAITLRAKLEAEIEKTKNDWRVNAVQTDFDNSKKLLGLKTTEDLVIVEQNFENSLKTLDQQLKNDLTKIDAGQKNELERMKVKDEYDLNKLNLTQQNNLALNEQRAGLETIARKDAQAFTAKENVLRRAFEKAAAGDEATLKLRLQQRGFDANKDAAAYDAALRKELSQMGISADIDAAKFEADLRRELKEMDFSQAEIDREINKVQQAFENEITTEKLTLEKAKQVLDENYKMRSIALDEELAAMPDFMFEQIDDGNETILMKINKKTGDSSEVLRTKIAQEPDYRNITFKGRTTPVDISTEAGKKLADSVAAAVASGDTTAKIEKIGTTRQVNPKAYFSENTKEVLMSYDRGNTFVRPDGTIVSQADMTGTVFPLSDEKTYEIHRNSRISARALEKLGEIDSIRLSGIDTSLKEAGLKALSDDDKRTYLEVSKNIRKGTGVLSKFAALINGIVGQIPGIGKFSSELFKDNTEARQYVRTARITLRAALVNSPRFPVTELQQTEELLADEKNWIVNPYSEVGRMEDLARVLQSKKATLLKMVAEGLQDQTMTSAARTKIMEIELAEKYLSPLLEISRASGASEVTSGYTEEELEAMRNVIQQ